MADEHDYEITVIATDKAGRQVVGHAEYRTDALSTNVPREIIDHSIKQAGNDRMREIDPSR